MDERKEQIFVSVRSLVEFIYRSGDLDNRSYTASEKAMAEGNRIHRLLQKREGIGYQAEVSLSHSFFTGRYEIVLEGRADGIISAYCPNPIGNPEETAICYVDEIKGTYRSMRHIKQVEQVHLSQAKSYAYMYLVREELEEIGVRITYCNMETEEVRYFHFRYTKEEIEAWFFETMAAYQKWTDYSYDWKNRKVKSIQSMQFPFPYREGQKQLLAYVYQSVKEEKKLFLQAPTGVGKTISTIYPSLKAVGEGMGDKIFYLTAKTITRTVAEQTFSLLKGVGLACKTLTLTAKDKICPMEKTNCTPVACERAKGHFERVNDCMYEMLTREETFVAQTIAQYASEYKVCPFELSLDLSLFVDAIICDYNYVFDPRAYLRRFFGENSKSKHIFLIDEAHNLLERGRDMYSASLYKEHVLSLKAKLKESGEGLYHVKKILVSLNKINTEMLAFKRSGEGLILLHSIEYFVRLLERLKEQMDAHLEEVDDSPVKEEILEFYFELSHFLSIYDIHNDKYVIYGLENEQGEFFVKMLNVDPCENLAICMQRGRSTTLFSATFLPIQYYKSLLGGVEEDYEAYAHSVFESKKRGVFIASDVSSKYARRTQSEYEKIAYYIYATIQAKDGNYLVFCPSYAYMERLCAAMDLEQMKDFLSVRIQKESMTEEEREEFLRAFEENRAQNLVGFCVMGGIFSEGIDLREESLIGAIIVGTGFPMVGEERELLKSYFDEELGGGFDYAYRYPGMNKVLQSAGRVIRTVKDEGVVVLLDERFLQKEYQQLFPREWETIVTVNSNTVEDAIQDFWEERKLSP